MKTIIFYGSPHKTGNSATLAEYFIRGIGGGEVKRFYANEMNIKACQGCQKCFSSLEQFCATEPFNITL